jgi:hypothetical protein
MCEIDSPCSIDYVWFHLLAWQCVGGSDGGDRRNVHDDAGRQLNAKTVRPC